MRIDVRTRPGIAKNYITIDPDTKKPIPFCIMSDDETGEFLSHDLKNGQPYPVSDSLGRKLTGINLQSAKIRGIKKGLKIVKVR